MTTATQVPTSGFIAPLMPAAPPAGFNVPPAGDPRMPPSNPIVAPNQQPGWVPQGNAPAQPAAPAAQAPQPDVSSLVTMLQAALAGKTEPAPAAAEPAPVEGVRPNWMANSANEFDVNSISDPIIKSMATVLQTAGKDLDLDRVLGRALAHGDPTLVDVAYLNERGGPQAVQLAEIAKGIVQAVGAKADAITNEVYTLVGGEAAWHASVSAFNQAAPHELRVTVAQMLDSTNENFIKAGAKLVAEYGKSSGLLPKPGANLLNAASAGVQGQGMTREQFQAELRKLNQNDPSYASARESLFQRRALGKRSGY